MTGLAIEQCRRTFEDIGIESEARRLCDKRSVTDFDDFSRMCAALRHRRFMESIQPYLSMKVRIHNLRMPDRIVFEEDGTSRVEYKPLPQNVLDALSQIDDLIARQARVWGLTK